ncbi:hypothetical protein pEaSNUABM37_00202 [Erwinia phage pEa_SNUABM_37]|nr:hypothetical protein pEaSNUABM37_00202 [Erwinia phage pEa_SNUABM_37]QXO10672.1 hypothetical protein pEaSNUABM48_00202 [Erwinia phage pEa_SNUABM_48]
MTELVYITELVKLNHQDDVVAAREKGFSVQPEYGGFSTFSDRYAFGNWVCKLSNGTQMVQGEDYVQSIAKSLPAFVNAGLVDTAAVTVSDWATRFVNALKDETPLLYVKADFDGGDDLCEIGVLERAPHRDSLTESIDTERTWVIIASEYISGQVVEAIRLSHFTKVLKGLDIEYKLGARGPELK